jgi:hypothetical protein
VLYLALGGYIFLWLCIDPSQCSSILDSALSVTGWVHFSVSMQRSFTVHKYFQQCSIWHWVGTFSCGYARVPHSAEVFWTVLYLTVGGYIFLWLCKGPSQCRSILNSALSGTGWVLFPVAMQRYSVAVLGGYIFLWLCKGPSHLRPSSRPAVASIESHLEPEPWVLVPKSFFWKSIHVHSGATKYTL